MSAAPLVVTLALEPAAQQRYDEQRARLFPRSPVGAHVTLFHALPGEDVETVVEVLVAAAAREPFSVEVRGVLPLGRGTAYRVESRDLTAVHAAIRRAFADRLTRQDAEPLRAHLTVQNKVDPATARRTADELRKTFTPERVEALGLDLWAYRAGPWEHLQRVGFSGTRT